MAKKLLDSMGNAVIKGTEEVYVSEIAKTGSIVKGANLETRQLTIIGSDESVDRDGDIISVSGWMMENFLNNPVFLWAHDYSSVPIASAIKVTRKRAPYPHLVFEEQFAPEGIYPFADMILQLYALKQINACSVGFLPKEWEKMPQEDGDNDMFYSPKKFLKQELLELSGCAVPSNPSALQLAMKSFNIPNGVNADKAIDYLIGKATPEVKNKDDVQEEIDRIGKSVEFVDETEAKVHQVMEDIEKGEGENKEIVSCECIDCGHKMDIEGHCKDEVCPECGGTMRREDRPGPGEEVESRVWDDVTEEDILKIFETTPAVLLNCKPLVEKIGAVLSAKNKSNLKNAQELIQKVIDNAEPPEEESIDDISGLDDSEDSGKSQTDTSHESVIETILNSGENQNSFTQQESKIKSGPVNPDIDEKTVMVLIDAMKQITKTINSLKK